MPIGMHGYRLEVEAHIITAAAATVENLRQCVQAAGVKYRNLCSTRWPRVKWCSRRPNARWAASFAILAAARPTWPSTSMAMCGTPWCWQSAAITSPPISPTAAPADEPGGRDQERVWRCQRAGSRSKMTSSQSARLAKKKRNR
jgi:hypothetical protein